MRVARCAAFVALVIAVGACSDSDAGTDHVFSVTFDGSRCTAEDVPAELPAGNYTFVLTNLDEDKVGDLGVRKFVGKRENITEDEANALWQEAGGEGAYPFVVEPGAVESAYQDLNAERLELDANQGQSDYVLDPGSYWMRVHTVGPSAHWRCGFLIVTDT